MTRRWGVPPDMAAAAASLEQIPEQIGDWRLESSEELGETTVNMLECAGYFVRDYVNSRTGQAVKVALLLGPPIPITQHTPEICYSSRANTIIQPRQRVAIPSADGANDEYWALTFRSNTVEANLQRVYYAWTPGNRWSTEGVIRWTLARPPYLYKIQLASHLPAGTNLETDDACRKFLEDFAPVVRQYLGAPGN
jgi:hypothetical protein